MNTDTPGNHLTSLGSGPQRDAIPDGTGDVA